MKVLRTVISKGKTTVLAVMVTLLLVGAPAALAANGNPWILGKVKNVATATTSLGGQVGVNGPMLRITNNNAGADATALNLQVKSGHAPMRVNSNTRVDNLSVDYLDGKDSSAFLGQGAKAADAENLDGTDSTGFVRGNGEVVRRAAAMAPTGLFTQVFGHAVTSPNVEIYYGCPTNLATDGTLIIKNVGTETVNVFSDNGGASSNAYKQLLNEDFITQPAAASGEHITFQVQGAGMVTIELFSVHQASDNICHVQAQGLFAYQ